MASDSALLPSAAPANPTRKIRISLVSVGSLWEASRNGCLMQGPQGPYVMTQLGETRRAADMLEELGNGVEGSSSKSSSLLADLAALKGTSIRNHRFLPLNM